MSIVIDIGEKTSKTPEGDSRRKLSGTIDKKLPNPLGD